jgi:hypothetical protein
MMNLKVRLIRNWKKDLNRLINAIRLLRHIVSKGFIGPCPTASADLLELTPTTFPVVVVHIPKILKDFRCCPDFMKRFSSYISTIHFQITTGLNLTHMGEKAEGNASKASPGHGIQSVLLRSDLLPLLFSPLPEDAVVVGSTGSLELKGNFFPLFIKPVKGLFIIHGRDFLMDKVLSSPGGDEEEDVMGHCTKIDSETEDLSNEMDVGLCDGRIDLEFKPPFFGHLDSP